MTTDDIPTLARPAFFDGQQLQAADLDAVAAYHRRLGWLHNRSLHNWGIATGFAVTGRTSDRTVVVAPGYALDCQGRELILGEPRELPVPGVAGDGRGAPATFFLTASWLDDGDLVAVTRGGICGANGAMRRDEAPDLRWQDPDDRDAIGAFRPGLDVVLAKVEVQGCRLAKDVSLAERRSASPDTVPFIYAGSTVPGETQWRFWPDEKAPIGVVTTVSTTAAGFADPPRYQARVAGSRRYVEPDAKVPVFIDGYAQVAGPTAGGFDLQVILPAVGALEDGGSFNPAKVVRDETFPDRLTSELYWSVVWVGVEGG